MLDKWFTRNLVAALQTHNVDSTSRRRINVELTLFQRRVPAGLFFLKKKTKKKNNKKTTTKKQQTKCRQLRLCLALSGTVNEYRIYPKYLDTSTLYHTCSKIWTSTIYYPICLKYCCMCGKQTLSAASHLGLQCLLRHNSEYIR